MTGHLFDPEPFHDPAAPDQNAPSAAHRPLEPRYRRIGRRRLQDARSALRGDSKPCLG